MSFCSFESDLGYKVSGIKIWNNDGEINVQMPGYKGSDGRYYTYFEFTNKSAYRNFREFIVSQFLELPELKGAAFDKEEMDELQQEILGLTA
jgi:hypothetical protein